MKIRPDQYAALVQLRSTLVLRLGACGGATSSVVDQILIKYCNIETVEAADSMVVEEDLDSAGREALLSLVEQLEEIGDHTLQYRLIGTLSSCPSPQRLGWVGKKLRLFTQAGQHL